MRRKPEMSQQPCTLVFCWGAWGKDGAASKIPWWVVVSFSIQAFCPRPLGLLHLPLFLSLGLGPATLFSLSWSAEPHCVSFLLYLCHCILLPECLPPPPFFYLTSQSSGKCSLTILATSSLSLPSSSWGAWGLYYSGHFTPCSSLLKQEISLL